MMEMVDVPTKIVQLILALKQYAWQSKLRLMKVELPKIVGNWHQSQEQRQPLQ